MAKFHGLSPRDPVNGEPARVQIRHPLAMIALGREATRILLHHTFVFSLSDLVDSKIKRFVTANRYPDKSYEELFSDAGVEFTVIDRPELKISFLD